MTKTATITSAHVTLTEPGSGAPPLPTLMLFSPDPAAVLSRLKRFVVVAAGKRQEDGVRLTWGLPDPAMTLGRMDISDDLARDLQAHNQASQSVRILITQDTSGDTDRQALTDSPFYADWSGVLGASPAQDADHAVPVSGLGRHRARHYRKQGQFAAAVRVLLDEMALGQRQDGTFAPRVAYTLHEAALLAEALSQNEAWEYFETVALMIYPNCYDALIGLALCAQDAPDQLARLLGRAHVIRPGEEALKLFTRVIARSGGQPPRTVKAMILQTADETDLDEPLFHDETGASLNVPAREILAHLRALAPQ